MEIFEIIKFKDKDIELDVHISLVLETAFLSLNDMSLLFERSKSAISKQLSKITSSTVAKMETVEAKIRTKSGNGRYYLVTYYNMSVVLELANKLGSKKGSKLREFVDDYFNNKIVSKRDNIIIYDNGEIRLSVKVSPKENTIYLTQADIALLYDTTQQNI